MRENVYRADGEARTPVYWKRGPKWCINCLTRGALKGPNLPQARLNHQDALFPGHGKATHSHWSQAWAGEPAWLGVHGDATHQTPAFTGTVRTVDQQVLCALRFYATGSYQGQVASDQHITAHQTTISACVRAVATAIMRRLGPRWIAFPETAEQRAATQEAFLRRGSLPGVVGCVDGTFVAIKGPSKYEPTVTRALYWCRKLYYALNVMVDLAGAYHGDVGTDGRLLGCRRCPPSAGLVASYPTTKTRKKRLSCDTGVTELPRPERPQYQDGSHKAGDLEEGSDVND
ncbi:hypothetical protein HPB47_001979 [Ixodes persulcatus]|uniref:Uncharacterized protein n=1 Tax=Ixodes persulcatus TaxID=34615 RepID=A0AC60PMH7_IXOPE|nr:hypothetical protein HPB47_001979 [Ixodes persulcatus]